MPKKKFPVMVREPGGPTRIDLRKLPKADQERLGRVLLRIVREMAEEERKTVKGESKGNRV